MDPIPLIGNFVRAILQRALLRDRVASSSDA
jgi:hypothetical protein